MKKLFVCIALFSTSLTIYGMELEEIQARKETKQTSLELLQKQLAIDPSGLENNDAYNIYKEMEKDFVNGNFPSRSPNEKAQIAIYYYQLLGQLIYNKSIFEAQAKGPDEVCKVGAWLLRAQLEKRGFKFVDPGAGIKAFYEVNPVIKSPSQRAFLKAGYFALTIGLREVGQTEKK